MARMMTVKVPKGKVNYFNPAHVVGLEAGETVNGVPNTLILLSTGVLIQTTEEVVAVKQKWEAANG